MRLFVIRHGMPDYKTDTLTQEGVDQAKKLSQYYKDFPFDCIYCSSQGRAMQTAKFLAKPHDIEPIIQDWSREDLGANYYAVTTDEGRMQWAFWDKNHIFNFRKNDVMKLGKEWMDDPLFKSDKFKDGYALMAKDLDLFMESIGLHHDRENNCFKKIGDMPENVALVAHGGFAFSFISNLLDIPYCLFSTTMQCLDLTGVAVIDFEPVGDVFYARIRKFNDTSHLNENKLDEALFAGI